MAEAQIQCDRCEAWLAVGEGPTVECDCGNVFAVTVTKVLEPRQEAAGTPP